MGRIWSASVLRQIRTGRCASTGWFMRGIPTPPGATRRRLRSHAARIVGKNVPPQNRNRNKKRPSCNHAGGASACQKSLFDKLSNANRGAGFAFEKAAPGCAHNLCAVCAQIPHLPGVLCFVRGTRPRTKPIHTLFRRARRNSTRFFDSLKRVDAKRHPPALFVLCQQSFAPAGMASLSMTRFSFSSPCSL